MSIMLRDVAHRGVVGGGWEGDQVKNALLHPSNERSFCYILICVQKGIVSTVLNFAPWP